MADETWRYIAGGTVKHALSHSTAAVAACGVSPGWWVGSYAWLGTGSQEEYEALAARPACKRCLAKGYKP